ncbi:MAG: DNA recombination protein RmuC [Puniceicoccales bacterium]|jgi:DNA recombination protein RmuC|nr:DNA recombination protein RmuC [Puniceicoccales bacterium]
MALLLGFLSATLISTVVISVLGYNRYSDQINISSKNLEQVRGERDEYLKQRSELYGKLAATEKQLGEQAIMLAELRGQAADLWNKNAALEATRMQIDDGRERLKVELRNLSQEILEAKKTKFSEETTREIGGIVEKIKAEFDSFKRDIFLPESKSRTELACQLKVLFENVEKMQTEASNLTNALRCDSKTQGNFGEVQLENLLENAGLSRQCGDFICQGIGLNLKLNDAAAKPDFLVKLPQNQWVLIDAKVSLSAYERFVNATSDGDKAKSLNEHRISIKRHIDEVAKYHDILGNVEICPFLLMFIPIESAYVTAAYFNEAQASQLSGRDVAQYARDKGVIPVYPSTLFLTLRLIKSMWQVEKQNENAQEIAERGGRLYDKCVGLFEAVEDLNRLFLKVNDQFSAKILPKINGNGGLVSQCEDLRRLGARNRKSMINKNLEVL